MEHSILLFIGQNGTGKTFILSQLHPFAHLGNVDVRNNTDMIIDGKDGEKEIHFVNNDGDKYIISHHYLYKKNGRQIRSYIEKNGVELNKSGLVTTFSQIVEIEFGIDIGFLRIIRLGTNVHNLVSSKSTERKDFAVKLLTEVDEYIHDFKESTQKSRALNTELKLVVDKLKRFGSEDVESQLTGHLQLLEEKLRAVRESRENSIQEISKLKGIIESSINGTIGDLRKQVSDIQQTKLSVESELMEISNNLRKLTNVFVTTKSFDDLIDELEEEVKDAEKELTSVTTRIEVLSQNLSDWKNDSTDLENQIKAMKELDDSENVEEDLKKANEFHEQYRKYYENFSSAYDKDDILEDIALAQQVHDMICNLSEFSKKAREIYYKAYDKKKDPYQYCTNKLISLRTELSLCTITRKGDQKKLYPPGECQLYSKCAFYKALEVKDFRDMEDIKYDIEIIQEAIKIADGIHNIKILLSTRKKDFPIKVEFTNVVLDILNGSDTFYNFEEAQHMATFLEKYAEWEKNKLVIQKLSLELRDYNLRKESVDSGIVSRQKTLMIRISDGERDMKKLHKKKKKLISDIELGKERIEDAARYRDLTVQRDSAKANLESIDKELSSIEDKINLLKQFDEQSFSHKQLIETAESSINTLEHAVFDTKVKLREYQELSEKKSQLEQKYAKVGLVRRAVSSTEGIPLLYLNLHFSKARNLANRIISSVYGDTIRLEKIVINEKEFRIPYSKNGVEVDDIIYASEVESSVISLALSFALMEEFSGRNGYNVLLLDEVDGALDKGSKEKFLRVLENQMERIGCQQAFIISHNQLFENYPVDAFVTIDKYNQLDSFKEVNRIN